MRPSRQIGLAYAYRSGPPVPAINRHCDETQAAILVAAQPGWRPTELAKLISEATRVRAPDDPREFQPLLMYEKLPGGITSR